MHFSLRCQSHIYLKLYKSSRSEIRELQRIISDYKPTEMANGNTPSPLSPTSVGSQVRYLFIIPTHYLLVLFCSFLSHFIVHNLFYTFKKIISIAHTLVGFFVVIIFRATQYHKVAYKAS